MSNDMMCFPNTWEEFERQYGFNDKEEIYTNNARLIPSFRVKQWLDHLPSAEKRGKWIDEEYQRLIDETDDGQLFAVEKKWHCSRCGFSKGFRMYRPDEKYCPNCGARMKGEK